MNIESLTGSAHNDILTGSSGTNIILGGNGNDSINAAGGNDTVDGGAGNDALNGGGGTDTLTYASATAGVTVNLAKATAQATGGAGEDIITNFERLTGSAYNDVLTGNSRPNTINGGSGNDVLYGGSEEDFLYGGEGGDKLYGGAGSDVFAFSMGDISGSAIDKIMDFKTAEGDKIDISALLQTYDPLTHAIADFVEITTSGANSILKLDTNGGGNSFVQIATLYNVTGLTDEAALAKSGNLIA